MLLILFLIKALNDVLDNFFNGVDQGRTQIPGLHRETISATRRIVSILVWCFGLAVAYPYIPLSNSEAFKGLSVMLGFMLTLGTASIVTQLMSGLVLVYSRALSVGDFVDIHGSVGEVSEIGVLSTKVIDVRNVELTIPNAVLIGSPIRNYSRLPGERWLRHALAAGLRHADQRHRANGGTAPCTVPFCLPARPGRFLCRV